jgi:hypothetical protein
MFSRILIVFIAAAILSAPIESAIAQDVPSSITGTRESRLNQAVIEQKVMMSDSQRALVADKCQNAQLLLRQQQDKTDKLVRLRIETYETIQKELQAIKLRMGRQGVDASEIDLLIGKLQQGLDKFTLASNAYGASIDDINTLDCSQKPEQFLAGLLVARTKRSLLHESATNLKRILEVAQDGTFTQLKKRLTV